MEDTGLTPAGTILGGSCRLKQRTTAAAETGQGVSLSQCARLSVTSLRSPQGGLRYALLRASGYHTLSHTGCLQQLVGSFTWVGARKHVSRDFAVFFEGTCDGNSAWSAGCVCDESERRYFRPIRSMPQEHSPSVKKELSLEHHQLTWCPPFLFDARRVLSSGLRYHGFPRN